jgi:hypothetical protein
MPHPTPNRSSTSCRPSTPMIGGPAYYAMVTAVLVLVVILGGGVLCPALADMPATISTGYFFCAGPSADCTAASPLTTVNVASMIASASGAGNSSASFTAIRPAFNGQLYFLFPTATTTLPVHILVEDGSSSGRTSHCFIRGIVRSGSTIIIRGGSYELASGSGALLAVSLSLQLLSGSLLQITGMTLTNLRPFECGTRINPRDL